MKGKIIATIFMILWFLFADNIEIGAKKSSLQKTINNTITNIQHGK